MKTTHSQGGFARREGRVRAAWTNAEPERLDVGGTGSAWSASVVARLQAAADAIDALFGGQRWINGLLDRTFSMELSPSLKTFEKPQVDMS